MKADPVLVKLIQLRVAAFNLYQEVAALHEEYERCRKAKAEQAKQARRAA